MVCPKSRRERGRSGMKIESLFIIEVGEARDGELGSRRKGGLGEAEHN